MKGTIVIYILPHEVRDLRVQLESMLKAFKYSDLFSVEWKLHIMMGTSKEIIDWENSKLDINWFIDELNIILEDWHEPHIVELREDVLGCSDARRVAIDENPESDYFIWLDTDIVFDPVTLFYIDAGLSVIKENYDTDLFALTPEIVRVWDSTWDCLVNERFLNKPLGYEKTNNPYVDTVFDDLNGPKPTVEEVHNSVPGQPRFKFAGGWFNCYSGKLLRRIGIPKSLGPYGVEDTWLMHAMEKLVVQGRADIKQFKLKNIIVGENYLYRDDNKIEGVSLIDRRDEFRKEAHRQANIELRKL